MQTLCKLLFGHLHNPRFICSSFNAECAPHCSSSFKQLLVNFQSSPRGISPTLCPLDFDNQYFTSLRNLSYIFLYSCIPEKKNAS